jgi:purine nucleosidase
LDGVKNLKPIIFDVDTGIDDALAMAYALNSPELEVIGFTTVFGNVPVVDATRNTLAVLEKVEKTIPVYEGAAQTFMGRDKKNWPKHVHGEGGLGDRFISDPITKAESQYAPDFIIEQVKKSPHEITVIAVGPLTNLALAIKKSPEIIPLVKEVIIMGGAVNVPGNVNEYSEANIISDSEAAEYVCSSGIQLTLVGLDVTMKTLLPKLKLEKWRTDGREKGKFFADMTEFYIGHYERNFPGIKGCALHDPLAVGVAIDSSFVETETMNVKVVIEGKEAGRTVGSHEEEATTRVCTEVDANRFLEHFLKRVI